jgi:hypothetical protein
MNTMSNEAPRYLTIAGVVTSENRLELQPSYLIDHGQNTSWGLLAETDLAQVITVEVINGQGNLTLRAQILANPFCFYSEGSAGELFVATTIPFPEDARILRFLRLEKVIHEIVVPKVPPKVHLTWDLPERVAGRNIISWSAEHPEGLPLHSMVLYSHTNGDSWQPLSLSLEAKEMELDFDQLPGGRCKVKVLVTDGVNTSVAESPTFSVPDKGYRAMILTPNDGASITSEDTVYLQGQGFHFEEQRPELEDLTWTSSLDGELGRGAIVGVRLSPGRHEITLAVGSGKQQRVAFLTINVTSPASG